MNKENRSGEEANDVALEEASKLSRRDVFLLEMYKQCSAHLGRHVTAMWQCFAVLAAFAATLRLDVRDESFDYAIALSLLLCFWLIASNLDASAWFNRNITIITNIERLFLETADANLVHPFFTRPAKADRIINHFLVQIYFSIAAIFILISIHFLNRILIRGCINLRELSFSATIPYVVSFIAIYLLNAMHRKSIRQQEEVNKSCPGIVYWR